jgi:hypothetical protein
MSEAASKGPAFRITLVPLPDAGVPAEHRLRSLLKTALRVHRLKAVQVEEIPAQTPAGGEGAAAQAEQVRGEVK